MANLATGNFEGFKPGLLNISTTKQPYSPGFSETGASVFVEDGRGVKSGLRLGAELVEVIEPTTESGVVNVSFADCTYAKVADLKLLTVSIKLLQEQTLAETKALVEPLITTINALENENRELLTRINSLEVSISSILESNLITRLNTLETNYQQNAN